MLDAVPSDNGCQLPWRSLEANLFPAVYFLCPNGAFALRTPIEQQSIPYQELFLNDLGWEIPLAGLPPRYPPGLVARCRESAAEGGQELPKPLTVPGFTDGLALLARGLFGVTLVGCRTGTSPPPPPRGWTSMRPGTMSSPPAW
ncbi:MAG: hypothetical protein ACP5XB_24485 [Isosphaeraceae bacterium]